MNEIGILLMQQKVFEDILIPHKKVKLSLKAMQKAYLLINFLFHEGKKFEPNISFPYIL